MSDNWIISFPKTLRFIPDAAKQLRARDRFAEIAPDADEIELIMRENVTLFDCGGNFKHISVQAVVRRFPVPWWQEQMSEDYKDGFVLDRYATPCCREPAHNA